MIGIIRRWWRRKMPRYGLVPVDFGWNVYDYRSYECVRGYFGAEAESMAEFECWRLNENWIQEG